MKNYERVCSETTQSYVCFMFSIACKINLGLVKNNDGNLGGRVGLWRWKSGWEGGQPDPGNPGGKGGQKTLPSIGGVWIFSGITHL